MRSATRSARRLAAGAVAIGVGLAPCLAADDDPGGADEASSLSRAGQAVRDGFSYNAKALGFGGERDLVNPEISAELAGASRWQAESDLRIDLKESFDFGSAALRPRFDARWKGWDEDVREDASETEAYIHEWFVRGDLREDISVSCGRENLQWGPGYIVSPSNPFWGENGQRTPKMEAPGADFTKLVWSPDLRWTVSLIANTDEGRRNDVWHTDEVFDLVREQAAEQRDSVLRQVEEGYRAGLAELGDWVDARPRIRRRIAPRLLGAIDAARADAVRRVEDTYAENLLAIDGQESELAWNFERTYAVKTDVMAERKYFSAVLSTRESGDPRAGGFGSWNATDALLVYGEGSAGEGGDVEALAGNAYTFLTGGTLAIEYFYNDSGDPDAPIAQLVPPYRAVDPREVYLRRNYLLAQYVRLDAVERLDAALRWTYNLDDGSSWVLGQLSYDLADAVQVFAIGTVTVGDEEMEFASLLNRSLIAGAEWSF